MVLQKTPEERNPAATHKVNEPVANAGPGFQRHVFSQVICLTLRVLLR